MEKETHDVQPLELFMGGQRVERGIALEAAEKRFGPQADR